jgi:hypothetical protein
LVDLQEGAAGFTVIGAGKTAMDTCTWLMDAGVDADSIQWIRTRDPWVFNRASMQPLELVGAYMQLQAHWVEAAAEAVDGADFAHRLEAHDVLMRIDPDVEPVTFRGAIVSSSELESLRTIERVVRSGKVLRVATNSIVMDGGSVATDPGEIFIDCTAAGIRPTVARPVFTSDRITPQLVTIGIVPWSAATIGYIEASSDDDTHKNRLCIPVVFTGEAADLLHVAFTGMTSLLARGAEPDVAAWTERCRLNPAGGATDHLDDPRVPAAFATLGEHFGAAMSNLERRVGAPVA